MSKRSASEQSSANNNSNNDANGQTSNMNSNGSNGNVSTRYNRLLSILTKCLTQSRERIASDKLDKFKYIV